MDLTSLSGVCSEDELGQWRSPNLVTGMLLDVPGCTRLGRDWRRGIKREETNDPRSM